MNNHHYVNNTSKNQNQWDDLTKAPVILARCDVWTIALDLEYVSLSMLSLEKGSARTINSRVATPYTAHLMWKVRKYYEIEDLE